MTAEDQRQIVQDYIRIISTHDLDEVQALNAENAVAFPFRISLQLGDNQMTIDVIDVFELNESGKIQSMKAYWGPANSKMEPAA